MIETANVPVLGDRSLKSVSKLKKKGKRKEEKKSFFLELIETANVVPGDRMPKLVSKSERKGKLILQIT